MEYAELRAEGTDSQSQTGAEEHHRVRQTVQLCITIIHCAMKRLRKIKKDVEAPLAGKKEGRRESEDIKDEPGGRGGRTRAEGGSRGV